MIDFHSHILPKIDDGSQSIEQSIQMLQMSKEQGISTIIATPHFYIKRTSVEQFLEMREKSFNDLNEHIPKIEELPNILLGAEVKFFNGIGNFEQLKNLCINNTKYVLLEMPFEPWSKRVLREVENIIASRNIIPIIAHIERYIGFQKDAKTLQELINMNLLVQMNGEFVNSIFSRKKAISFLDSNIVQLIGSDCHNTTSRKPNLGKAYEIIRKKCGNNMVDKITQCGKMVLYNNT